LKRGGESAESRGGVRIWSPVISSLEPGDILLVAGRHAVNSRGGEE